MKRESGKSEKQPSKKRGAPLEIDLPFDEAIKAALETRPPSKKQKQASGGNVKAKLDE